MTFVLVTSLVVCLVIIAGVAELHLRERRTIRRRLGIDERRPR